MDGLRLGYEIAKGAVAAAFYAEVAAVMGAAMARLAVIEMLHSMPWIHEAAARGLDPHPFATGGRIRSPGFYRPGEAIHPCSCRACVRQRRREIA